MHHLGDAAGLAAGGPAERNRPALADLRAAEQRPRPLHGFDHLADSDRLGWPGEPEPAPWAAGGPEQACPHQRFEQLGEIGLGQVIELGQPPGRQRLTLAGEAQQPGAVQGPFHPFGQLHNHGYYISMIAPSISPPPSPGSSPPACLVPLPPPGHGSWSLQPARSVTAQGTYRGGNYLSR